MEKIILPLIILGIIATIVELLSRSKKLDSDNDLPDIFHKKEYLLNIPERRFFELLQKNMPAEYIVFPQIVISSIIGIRGNRHDFWTYLGKINKKTIDFVVFKKPYLEPVLAIEYDGHTHEQPKRIIRDNFVDHVCQKVGIKMVHIKHSDNIDNNSAKEALKNLYNEFEKNSKNRMEKIFVIEDEAHAETHGKYQSFEDAVTELKKLTHLSWNEDPNKAPCVGWENCGRNYKIIEYNVSSNDWQEIKRTPGLIISAKEIKLFIK